MRINGKLKGVNFGESFNGILGLFIIIVGAILGFWVGFILMFAGGIMDVVDVVRGIGGLGHLVVGLLKFCFCWIGWIIFYLGIIIGVAVAD